MPWLQHHRSIDQRLKEKRTMFAVAPWARMRTLVSAGANILRLMESRTIRAWHYTLMTDTEIDALRQTGINPSSLDTIQSRFAA